MRNIAAILVLGLAAGAVAAADSYVLDANHTFTAFEFNHLGLSTSAGRFDTTRGAITLDLGKKAGTADITIDVKSVNTGVPKFNDHLLSAEFFDAARYPTITFRSDRFRFEGETLREVSGDLTVHGVTRPVTLKVVHFACLEHPVKKVFTCGANAVATVKRSDFELGAYAPAIGDDVTLRVQIEAAKR